MPFVKSRDGTPIAYETRGTGPALILVDGAMCSRDMGPMPAIADAIGDGFTIYLYDRRDRGESGNTLPYDPEREIEDLQAIIEAAGGKVNLFGISSGALFAAKTAQKTKGIDKLALFEAPMVLDDTETALPADFRSRIEEHITRGDKSGAVKIFMSRVGVPRFVVAIMSLLPFWKKVLTNAHTLPNDLMLVEKYQQQQPLDPAEWQGFDMPVLVMDGGKSPTYMRNAQSQWAAILNADYITLPGQTHNVKAEAIAPVLREFFK